VVALSSSAEAYGKHLPQSPPETAGRVVRLNHNQSSKLLLPASARTFAARGEDKRLRRAALRAV
jgi:hypothetical protein